MSWSGDVVVVVTFRISCITEAKIYCNNTFGIAPPWDLPKIETMATDGMYTHTWTSTSNPPTSTVYLLNTARQNLRFGWANFRWSKHSYTVIDIRSICVQYIYLSTSSTSGIRTFFFALQQRIDNIWIARFRVKGKVWQFTVKRSRQR
jgi:hypothetical protein